jgi:Na+-driven multidrug efflux pump
MGIKGPALASSVSQILNMFILWIYLNSQKDLKEMWFFPNKECFRGLINYMKLGFWSLGLIWLEWCAFEFMTFMSGYLDVESTSG